MLTRRSVIKRWKSLLREFLVGNFVGFLLGFAFAMRVCHSVAMVLDLQQLLQQREMGVCLWLGSRDGSLWRGEKGEGTGGGMFVGRGEDAVGDCGMRRGRC